MAQSSSILGPRDKGAPPRRFNPPQTEWSGKIGENPKGREENRVSQGRIKGDRAKKWAGIWRANVAAGSDLSARYTSRVAVFFVRFFFPFENLCIMVDKRRCIFIAFIQNDGTNYSGFFFNENVMIDWKCDRCVR